MATVKCIIILVCVLCQCVRSSQVLSVLKEVQHCFHEDLEPCLVNHTIESLLDATNLTDASSNVDDGARSTGNGSSVEEKLIAKLMEAFAISNTGILDDIQRGRSDPVLRTFNRAWKYIIPLLIGVILKLATFVPFVLTILTLIAKSAFVSGNVALLLTGLNIVLKYWYPKMGEHPPQQYNPHSAYQHPEEYGHHQNIYQPHSYPHQNFFQNQQHEQLLNNFENQYKNQKLSDVEFGTNIIK